MNLYSANAGSTCRALISARQKQLLAESGPAELQRTKSAENFVRSLESHLPNQRSTSCRNCWGRYFSLADGAEITISFSLLQRSGATIRRMLALFSGAVWAV